MLRQWVEFLICQIILCVLFAVLVWAGPNFDDVAYFKILGTGY
jgi:hypothetical protein